MHNYPLIGHDHPEAVVAVGKAGDRSAATLCADATAVAARLPAASPGSQVLLACHDRYHFAVALLASCLKGHAVALPPNYVRATLEPLLREPTVVAGLHDGDGVGLLLPDMLPGDTGLGDFTLEPIPAERAFVTLYTSGSTGAPQAVPKTAAQVLGEVNTLASTFGGQLQCIMATVPPRHIYGLLFGVLLPLRTGARFVRETPLQPDAIAEVSSRQGAETLVAVPAHLRAFSGRSRGSLGCLKQVFSSGAPLPAQDFATLDSLALNVYEIFGSTETGGIAHRSRSDQPWQPFVGVSVDAGPDSELLLRSPLLDAGEPQPRVCEDRIELRPDGRFVHRGRADAVVKVGATRVGLRDVEARIAALPRVRDVSVLAVDVGGARGKEIRAVVAADNWDGPGMRAALRQWLDPMAIPRRLRFVDTLPREATGKLRRQALLALFETEAAKSTDSDVFPVLSKQEHSEAGRDELQLQLHVPADLPFFQGHFDSDALLPGVVQLQHLAVEHSRTQWPDLPALRRVRRLKFKRPIRPDEQLTLHLSRPAGDPRVDFRINAGQELCSTGTLLFAGDADP